MASTSTDTDERPRSAGPGDFGSVAIVHDYLNQRGGAERVVLEMASMWPSALIYTSLYRPNSTFPEFAAHEVRTSFLNRLPVDEAFRWLLPIYPAAFLSLGKIDADLIISSSSGWGHGIRRPVESCHVVYCHNPARWLYGEPYMNASSIVARNMTRPLLTLLRRHDRRSAARANLYIANSEATRIRIREVYGLDAAVVPPPVDTGRFTPRPRGDRLLVVSRLLPYKRIDLAVNAATEGGIGLDVVGEGPSLAQLQSTAGPSVAFHGRLADEQVTDLMENCRAFCLPGSEDFGIAPVEAQAAGKPVVAFAAGGALETVTEGVTGAFFHQPTPSAMLAAIRRADIIKTSPSELGEHADKFSRAAFRRRLLAAIANLPRTAGQHGASR